MLKAVDNLEILAQQGLPGEHERLRLAMLTDQHGMLSATRARLAHIAQARGVDSSAIEDVVQETLLEAWSHLGRLTAPAGFHLWIDEICRNVCRRYMRKQQAYMFRYVSLTGTAQNYETSLQDEEPSLLDSILDNNAADPLDVLSQQEVMRLLDAALALLPQETRKVVEMCHLREMSYSEAAERLGISIGALYTRLHRARLELRKVLHGPLRDDAAALDLIADKEQNEEWFDTRLWCSSCGRYHLQGMFMHHEASGKRNMHVRCPGCSQQYGMDMVHSMGMVSLATLKSFRPALKHTLQSLTELVLKGLATGDQPCPWCGHSTTMQVADTETDEGDTPPLGPYQYWVRWSCARCGGLVCFPGDLPSVDQIVSWSHPRAREFMAQYPHHLSLPTTTLEHNGQETLAFQLTDMSSAAKLTILAHRHTLRILRID